MLLDTPEQRREQPWQQLQQVRQQGPRHRWHVRQVLRSNQRIRKDIQQRVLAHGYAAGYPYGYAGYFGGLVGHANGAVVPVDEPAVVAAKAAHAAAGGAIHAPVAYAGYAAGYPYGYAAGYPYGYAGYPYGAPVHAGFAGLVAHPNGAMVPVEPADVVAARAEHLAAKAEA